MRTHKVIGPPIGELTMVATGGVLDGLYMEGHAHMPEPASFGEPSATGFEEVVADAIGDRSVIRAVGAANGRNPISIIVPCHRLVGSDGALTGYAGGLDRKRFLLDLETPDDDRPVTLC